MSGIERAFWTPEEMAEQLSISTEQLSQLRSRGGSPPFIYVGRQVRYLKVAVAQWARETQMTSTSPGRVGRNIW